MNQRFFLLAVSCGLASLIGCNSEPAPEVAPTAPPPSAPTKPTKAPGADAPLSDMQKPIS